MTDEELEKIRAKKDKIIHIHQFVWMVEVSMICCEKYYYCEKPVLSQRHPCNTIAVWQMKYDSTIQAL